MTEDGDPVLVYLPPIPIISLSLPDYNISRVRFLGFRPENSVLSLQGDYNTTSWVLMQGPESIFQNNIQLLSLTAFDEINLTSFIPSVPHAIMLDHCRRVIRNLQHSFAYSLTPDTITSLGITNCSHVTFAAYCINAKIAACDTKHVQFSGRFDNTVFDLARIKYLDLQMMNLTNSRIAISNSLAQLDITTGSHTSVIECTDGEWVSIIIHQSHDINIAIKNYRKVHIAFILTDTPHPMYRNITITVDNADSFTVDPPSGHVGRSGQAMKVANTGNVTNAAGQPANSPAPDADSSVGQAPFSYLCMSNCVCRASRIKSLQVSPVMAGSLQLLLDNSPPPRR